MSAEPRVGDVVIATRVWTSGDVIPAGWTRVSDLTMTQPPTPPASEDVERVSVALQRAGALSDHISYADLARCFLAALTDGRDDLGAPDEHDQHARHTFSAIRADPPASGEQPPTPGLRTGYRLRPATPPASEAVDERWEPGLTYDDKRGGYVQKPASDDVDAARAAKLRAQVIREITVAPGWNKADATALVDELTNAIRAEAQGRAERTPPDPEPFGILTENDR